MKLLRFIYSTVFSWILELCPYLQMRGKGSGRRINHERQSRLLNQSQNVPPFFFFAFGRPDTNNYRKITRSLYCLKNNFPYEAD